MEQEASLWMQGRMVELLLRYDTQRFGRIFVAPQSDMVAELRYQHDMGQCWIDCSISAAQRGDRLSHYRPPAHHE